MNEQLESLVAALERRAFEAWPAATVEDVDGWRLRYTSGVTRRANSVWPAEARGALSLEARIERAERFYEERGAPAFVQIVPLPGAAGLDEALENRGYAVEAPVWIQTAPIAGIKADPAPTDLTVTVQSAYDEAWLHVAVQRGRFREVRSIFTGILDRIGAKALFAIARDGAAPVAIALAVLDLPYLGVFNMVTVPEYRRRGAARSLLTALARAGELRHAAHAYLQVERENVAALALYASAGFTTRYGYHYRLRAA